MKRILCYGDSNTWGAIPGENGRYDAGTRFPRVLEDLLGDDYEVVEEGLPGRTTVYHTDVDRYVCGADYLPPCLSSHAPLDVVVLMLGTNDLSTGVHVNAYYAAAGADRLVKLIRSWGISSGFPTPEVLIVSPPLIDPCVKDVPVMREVFDPQYAPEQSRHFREHYRDAAGLLGCRFLAAEDYVETGCDGVHMTAGSHRRLAEGLCENIRAMTGEDND